MRINTAPADPASARLLHSYAAQYGAALAANTSASTPTVTATPIALTIDGQYRIRLQALPRGGVVVQSRLRNLPEPGWARDELLLGVARLACGTMKEHAAAVVVDERERALWLQQAAPANSHQDIDDAVGSFVNCLALWSKAVNTF